jgi:hypothetical protein
MDELQIQEHIETLNLSEASKTFYLRHCTSQFRFFGFHKENDLRIIKELVEAGLAIIAVDFFDPLEDKKHNC